MPGQSRGARHWAPTPESSSAKLGAVRDAPWIDHDKPRHSHYEGFDLHADVAIGAHDRQGLEKLLRYGARSAVAGERLHLAQDGRVVFTLRRSYHDGTSQLVFEPTTFIERLAALVPRPQKNLTIYGGVLAPNAKFRSRVIAFAAVDTPTQPSEPPPPAADGGGDDSPTKPQSTDKPLRPNYAWAELMRRAFEVDVLACPHCGGRLKLLAAVMSTEAIRAILANLRRPRMRLSYARRVRRRRSLIGHSRGRARRDHRGRSLQALRRTRASEAPKCT